MAITKIHPIKHTLGKSITYIGNALKTENGKYISTYGCAYETAELEFALTAQSAQGGGQNQAYHLIQSFKEGEVTAEQCHELGKKFADEVLGGKYEYVLCTHTDKGHYHNHIIFNAVSFKDFKRYRSDKKSYFRIRDINDKLCVEHGLNIIEESNRRNRYERKKTYISNKYIIKNAIDECILFAVNYDDFLRRMSAKNFTARQDEFLWFRQTDNKRFTKTDTIGSAYSRENIEKRIKGIYRPTTTDLLIDIEHNVKCQQSKGYEQWAKIHNLKLIAQTLNILKERGLINYDVLSKRVSDQSAELKSVQDGIKSRKKRISEIDVTIKNVNTYRKLMPIYKEYQSKNPLTKNSFYVKHKQEIDLFEQVTNELKSVSANNKLPSIKQLEAEKKNLQSEISEQSVKYEEIRTEYSEISTLKKNVDMFLNLPQEQPKKKPSLLKKLTEHHEQPKRQDNERQQQYKHEQEL